MGLENARLHREREREREHARATANYRETFELLGSDISSSLGVGNVR